MPSVGLRMSDSCRPHVVPCRAKVVADQPPKNPIKISAKIVRHGCYVAFQKAEIVIPRGQFAGILRRIDQRRRPAAPECTIAPRSFVLPPTGSVRSDRCQEC